MVLLMTLAKHQQRLALLGLRLAQKLLCHCRRLRIKGCRWSLGRLPRRFPSPGREALPLPMRLGAARA
jgi:hypothetical protein